MLSSLSLCALMANIIGDITWLTCTAYASCWKPELLAYIATWKCPPVHLIIHCTLTNNIIQILYYAPKMVESWKGQKLLSRAEFHVGAHLTKFMRLQMLPTPGLASEKTNRFALLFGTLDGGIGCIAPIDELTFRRLQSLQRKLVDAVPHVCGLNPRSFRQFKSNGKAHRPGPDNVIDFELLAQ